MNDQHAYLRIPPDADVLVGDLVGCGISHPCTAFDKWRVLLVVDDDYAVTGAVRTFSGPTISRRAEMVFGASGIRRCSLPHACGSLCLNYLIAMLSKIVRN